MSTCSEGALGRLTPEYDRGALQLKRQAVYQGFLRQGGVGEGPVSGAHNPKENRWSTKLQSFTIVS
jgi:hypothetical protein